MKLNFITIMLEDIKKSIKFYEEILGLKVVRSIELDNGHIKFLSNAENETMIELIEMKNSKSVRVEGMIMSFKSEDLLEVREKAISLEYKVSEIKTFGDKPEHFIVEDPNGLKIEISI